MEKYKDKSLNIEERIDDLLSKMTNEEKVGQMLQVSYNTLSKEDYEKYNAQKRHGSAYLRYSALTQFTVTVF